MSSIRHARFEKSLIELTYERLQDLLDRFGRAYDEALKALQDAQIAVEAARAYTDNCREYVNRVDREYTREDESEAVIIRAAYSAFVSAVRAEQDALQARDDALLAVKAARRIFVQVFDFEP